MMQILEPKTVGLNPKIGHADKVSVAKGSPPLRRFFAELCCPGAVTETGPTSTRYTRFDVIPRVYLRIDFLTLSIRFVTKHSGNSVFDFITNPMMQILFFRANLAAFYLKCSPIATVRLVGLRYVILFRDTFT